MEKQTKGAHRLPEQCPRMVLQWGAETQGSPGPTKWLPSTPLPLGMVASGSSSKVQVDYANAAPLSAIPLIYVFACFLQACQTHAIIYLPIPILSWVCASQPRGGPHGHTVLPVCPGMCPPGDGKEEKGIPQGIQPAKTSSGELEAGALVWCFTEEPSRVVVCFIWPWPKHQLLGGSVGWYAMR